MKGLGEWNEEWAADSIISVEHGEADWIEWVVSTSSGGDEGLFEGKGCPNFSRRVPKEYDCQWRCPCRACSAKRLGGKDQDYRGIMY